MIDASPFSGRILTALAGAALAVFALSFVLSAHGGGENSIGDVVQPSTYSRSAIGQAGLYELLKRQGLEVARSGNDAMALAGYDGVYVMAEPDLAYVTTDIALRPTRAQTVLLVLPKWRGARDADRPDWIGQAVRLPSDRVRAVAALVDGKAEVATGKPQGPWTVNQLGAAPSFGGEVQLLRSPDLVPIVASADGTLLGELRDGFRRIWVLADPDVISNHGLARAGNPTFAMALIKALHEVKDGRIVFDEAVHGITGAPESPLKLLLTFPYSVVTLLLLLSVAVLLWATMARFGRPQPSPPALHFGKESLIANAAALLDYAGHQDTILRRYARVTLYDVGRSLHAPADLDEPGLAAWLDRIAAARGVRGRAADILARIDALRGGQGRDLTTLFTAVRELHRWKGDILDGSSAHTLRH